MIVRDTTTTVIELKFDSSSQSLSGLWVKNKKDKCNILERKWDLQEMQECYFVVALT